MKLSIKTFSGTQIASYLDNLASLRIKIFKDYPYLYEGNFEYEKAYLKTYLKSSKSLLILVLDQERVVGASTGIPLAHEAEYVQKPFIDQQRPLEKYFYFGESVLEKDYRGHGVGVKFFELREAYARSLGDFEYATFCAVEREEAHPQKPPQFKALDEFWTKRGYLKDSTLQAYFAWKELGNSNESEKIMSFWTKKI